MKKTVLRMILIGLLLALIGGVYLLSREQNRMGELKARADALMEQQSYTAAIPAYGQLLQQTPYSFLGRDKARSEEHTV